MSTNEIIITADYIIFVNFRLKKALTKVKRLLSCSPLPTSVQPASLTAVSSLQSETAQRPQRQSGARQSQTTVGFTLILYYHCIIITLLSLV